MNVGAAVLLIAIGVLLAVFVNSTLGIILAVLGVVGMLLTSYGTWGRRGDVVIERERPARREVVRERY